MKTKKENLILVIGTVIILGAHLVGCDKIPLPPPVVVEPELAPTLELSITPEGVIPYGEDGVVINFQTENANQVLVNGVRKPSVKSGTHTLNERIFKDTTLNVKAINIKKMVEKSVTIQVGDWTTSTFGLVSYYPWRFDSLGRSSLDGKILKRWEAAPELLSSVTNFHRDGRYINSDYPTAVVQWSVPDSNTIVINGSTSKLQVNQEEMIISVQTTYNGELVWFDTIYKHASDTPTDPV